MSQVRNENQNFISNLTLQFFEENPCTQSPFLVFDKLKNEIENFILRFCFHINMKNEIQISDGSRAAATSKMESFVIIFNGFQPLIIITKCSTLDVAAALYPLLQIIY